MKRGCTAFGFKCLLIATAVAAASGAPGVAQEASTPDKREPTSVRATEGAQLVAPGSAAAFGCDTEAIGMDFTPFKKTNGLIQITVKREPQGSAANASPNTPAGTWQVSGKREVHVASILKLVHETCANGCPFTLSGKGEVMLWAPLPKPLDKLSEAETLTIAVIKPEPLSISISTFRGREIVALEKGTCRKIEGDTSSDPAEE